MALSYKITDLKEVNPTLHELYEEDKEGGGYILKVEGLAPPTAKTGIDPEAKRKLAEFRDRNIKLQEDLEAAKAAASRYQGLDPEKAREALEKVDKLSEQALIDEGKIDQLISHRTEQMRDRFEGQIATLQDKNHNATKELESYREKYNATIIDHSIANAIQEVGGIAKGAAADIRSRAKQVWKLGENEQPIATRPNGHFIYSEDGSTPVSMKEWLTNLRHDAPHLFQPATGGGSGGASTTNVAPPGGAVDWNNPVAIKNNLEDIASGKVPGSQCNTVSSKTFYSKISKGTYTLKEYNYGK